MWEFLGSVLDKAGFVATVFMVVILACGGAVFALWKQNQKLHEEFRSALEKAMAARIEKADEIGKTHAAELRVLAEDHAKRLAEFARRVDELQERRVKEAGTLTERVMDHIKNIDTFAAKLEATIDVILQATRHR